MVVTATVDDVPLDIKEKIREGSYTLSYKSTEAGDKTFTISIGIKDTKDGSIYTLVNKTHRFVVKPSIPIKINARPTYIQAWRSLGLHNPLVQEKAWKVLIGLEDLNHNAIDPTQIAGVDPNALFEVSILNGASTVSSSIMTTYVGKGKYLISGTGLQKGDYKIGIDPKPVLSPGYVWLDNNVVSSLKLVDYPIVIITQIFVVLVAIALIYVLYLLAARFIQSRNPCGISPAR
ncbi:MAG: hypothetical protein MZV64_62965 [Ignavibacteriales bacterium]|nr:hypothetical protein [Ignavibacteriales bacterium]